MQVAYNMNKLPWKKKVILKYCGNIIVEKKCQWNEKHSRYFTLGAPRKNCWNIYFIIIINNNIIIIIIINFYITIFSKYLTLKTIIINITRLNWNPLYNYN